MKVIGNLIKFYESHDRLVRKGYSSEFIKFLALDGISDRRLFKNKEFMEGLFERLQVKGFHISDIELTEEGGYYEFSLTETKNGGQTSTVSWDFFSSPELRQLIALSDEFRTLHEGGFIIEGNGEKKRFEDPQELLNQLVEKAKKGVTIQRYKGLGEMNPDQLWSTTMDPEKRGLLKVKIEDEVEADGIFTILMGDKVEPRRDFIQSNALEVTELDI